MIPSLEQLSARLADLAGAMPATATSGPAPVPPRSPVQPADFAGKGYHLDVTVAPGAVDSAAGILDQHGFALDTITGVDWIAQNEMEVIYDYFHAASPLRIVIRTRVPRDHPELPTISAVFPGANWHEREAHDFFGLRFLGHPDLSPFLLPEDATYHPLRKDFSA
ncbi:MAG TPA: NADH-quinone oxidoreductase subunit C [Opitutaceae bacterium]|nr:NADH-quinone oxidoreductase subunit C [Opitutaceae bacterium]